METETYKIVLEPLPGWDGPPPVRRLARLLKAILRSYGFRVAHCDIVRKAA